MHCFTHSPFYITFQRCKNCTLSSVVWTRQPIYFNVALMTVRAIILLMEKPWALHNLSVYICSLGYPACNVHAPYCHLCPALLYDIYIFFTFSHKWHGFQKNIYLQITKCVLIFSITVVRNIYHSKKKLARYDRRKYIGIHVKQHSFLSDFNSIWIFSKDFRKILKYQFYVYITNYLNFSNKFFLSF